MKNIYTPLLAFSLSLFPAFCDAQWSSDPAVNTPICTVTGRQVDIRMVKDGKNGSYITWKDFRAGVSDIYAQRVNGAGVPLWDSNGKAICTQSSDQSTPAIISDMKGGAIITWSDWRSGIERDIYAQRVDSNGNIKWAFDGVIVTNKSNREHNPKIISDGAGGAIIAWEQQTSGLWDIWAQRIDSNGMPMWTPGGIALAPGATAANRMNPKIEKDGKGGAIIVWQDERTGTFDIYAQRVTGAGVLKWGNSAKSICSFTGIQNNPKIDPDSLTGGAFVVWVDKRSGTYDIYGQRIDSNGTDQWSTNGVVICGASGSQSAPDIMSNEQTNGLYIVWKDKRNSNYDIYAQKMTLTGTPAWTANGVVVSNNAKDQLNPNVIQDNGSGAIVVWQDSSGGSMDIRAQHLNAAGAMQWAANGVAVGTATGDQEQPKNVADGKGGTIIAFEDNRSGTADVYIHHLYSNGTTVNGIDDQESLSELNIYPNPFRNELTLSFQSALTGPVNVTGYDLMGRTVPSFQTAKIDRIQGGYSISIKTDVQLVPGVYLLRVGNGQQTSTIRVMKEL